MIQTYTKLYRLIQTGTDCRGRSGPDFSARARQEVFNPDPSPARSTQHT